MGYKTLELTLISANDLKKVNLIGKMDVYVVVFISNDPRNKQITPIHKDGDTNPFWNYTVRFTVDESALVAASSREMVVFQLKHKSKLGPDKDIGEVIVPINHLKDVAGDRILSYKIRRPSGKLKGELKFSYKIKDYVVPQPPPQTAYPATGYPAPPPAAAYGRYVPVGPQQQFGYGYGYPQSSGYGVGYPRRNGGFGMGMGAGLLGGALGGMLIGDMVSDYAYDDGYYDGGAFDGGAADFDMDF